MKGLRKIFIGTITTIMLLTSLTGCSFYDNAASVYYENSRVPDYAIANRIDESYSFDVLESEDLSTRLMYQSMLNDYRSRGYTCGIYGYRNSSEYTITTYLDTLTENGFVQEDCCPKITNRKWYISNGCKGFSQVLVLYGNNATYTDSVIVLFIESPDGKDKSEFNEEISYFYMNYYKNLNGLNA